MQLSLFSLYHYEKGNSHLRRLVQNMKGSSKFKSPWTRISAEPFQNSLVGLPLCARTRRTSHLPPPLRPPPSPCPPAPDLCPPIRDAFGPVSH